MPTFHANKFGKGGITMPLITISRGIGCGGMAVARLVSEGLKVELFDDHRLQEEAIKIGLELKEFKVEELKDVDSRKAPGLFHRILHIRSEIYLDCVEALVYEAAKKGDGVIIGHGSQMLLQDFECALHVHIYASESTRIQNLMTQKGLSEEAARKLILKSDHEQKGFFQFAFHMDWNDPSLYDLIINTEQIGLDLAARIIMEVAASDQMKACSLTALDAMEKLSLKKKVQAVLMENNISLSYLHLDVPEKGVVEIIGAAHSTEEKKKILKTLKTLSGVSKIEENIVVLSRHHGI
jgi:cytidylate kinase